MKKIAFTLLAVLGFAGYSFAGVETGKDMKEYKSPAEAAPCFKDTEIQLDIFGAYEPATHSSGSEYFHNGAWGGGVGVNYFFARYFGIGAEGDWVPSIHVAHHDSDHDVVNSASGSLILRYPLELAGHLCLAPYVFGGGGGHWDGTSEGEGHAGLGLEYRATQHVGIFSDGRYVWNTAKKNDTAEIRMGVRLAF